MVAAERQVLETIAGLVGPGQRVGVDGVDGAGKSTFADALARALRGSRHEVVRVSLDDFHQVRAARYRRGRESAEGFWLDSYDYDRFRTDVLKPFGPGGTRRFRPVGHDLVSDAVLDPPWQQASPRAVLVVDGLFLHRTELASAWDVSVFLDVAFAISAERMARRDGTPADPDHRRMRRYVQGQRLYLTQCRPRERATIVVDNSDVAAPRIVG